MQALSSGVLLFFFFSKTSLLGGSVGEQLIFYQNCKKNEKLVLNVFARSTRKLEQHQVALRKKEIKDSERKGRQEVGGRCR